MTLTESVPETPRQAQDHAVDRAPSIELLLRDLPGNTSMFDRSTPAEVVHEHFKAYPLLPAILIADGFNLMGMLPRSTFFQLLSRPHGADVYNRRPISLMLEHANVKNTPLSSEESVQAAVDWCLSRPGDQIYEPIVVASKTECKVVHFHDLIVAQSRLLEQTKLRIEEQHLQLKEKNQEILDSIIYAERIQKSMLQRHREFSRPGLGLFFLFRPRDIVSGDFFWTAQVEEKILVAAVDCTGHGVPGAFMSMMGHNFLDDIVTSRGETQPNTILSLLHEDIRRSLNQSNAAQSSRDGMDVSLCALNTATGKLQFSGAKRPLYYTNRDGSLLSCRGDRFSIGGLQREEKRVFTLHQIDCEPGQTFFLTTDGYIDQPNEKNEKFGTMKLKALLESMALQPFAQKQLQLEAALDLHQGLQAQRDDISMVGLEWGRP